MNLTFVDILVGLVLAVSVFYAAWRGFLLETLSIFAWVAAGFAALYFGPWLEPWMHHHIATRWLALVAADTAMFLVVFIPLAFLSRRISNSVKSSAIGSLDRVLGFAYGAVRGLVIVGLCYIGFVSFVPRHDDPAALTHARTLPLMQKSAQILRFLVPARYQRGAQEGTEDPLGDLIRRSQEPANAEGQPVPGGHMSHARISTGAGAKGYGASDRHALDSLVEATGSGGSGKP